MPGSTDLIAGRSIGSKGLPIGIVLAGMAHGVLAIPASGQVVRGQVTDVATEQPVVSARVAVRNDADSLLVEVVTQATGEFTLLGLPEGVLVVEVSALGYTASAKRQIDYEGDPLFLAIELDPAPLEMEGIDVTVEAQDPFLRQGGYYQRKKVGHGHFLTPEQLNRMSITRPSDMFRRMPAVRVVGNGEPVMGRGPATFRECRPAVYQDGMLIRPSHSRVPFNDVVAPAVWIAAVEVYPGPATTPPQWRGSAACGVIAIWTRR